MANYLCISLQINTVIAMDGEIYTFTILALIAQ